MSIFSNLVESGSRKYAVAYYRHSKDKAQENSVKIQRDNVTAYAQQFGIEIIHEEIDDGFTGINDDRAAFQSLLYQWIANPEAPIFHYVLVNDMSRWGRWLDLDEAAVFRFHCKKHGKRLVCVDKKSAPKEKEDITDAIIATVEAHNAARHVELISSKTTDGAKEVSRQGYSAGGTPSYGLMRVLLDEQRNFVQILESGQHKFIANQRVIFAPANNEATKNVELIFYLFIDQWMMPEEIAAYLNERGILSPGGRLWSRGSVIHILTNEAYIGSRVYYKTSGPLKKERKTNPRSLWVIKENAFEAIIDPALFAIAQERIHWMMPRKWKRNISLTRKAKSKINEALVQLLKEHGYNDDQIFYVLQDIPLIYSVRFSHADRDYWCFLANKLKRHHEFVVGVGIAPDRKDNIFDHLFAIPIEDFVHGDYLIIPEGDSSYHEYLIEPKRIENQLRVISEEIVLEYSAVL